jgi:hypothetical protein
MGEIDWVIEPHGGWPNAFVKGIKSSYFSTSVMKDKWKGGMNDSSGKSGRSTSIRISSSPWGLN